MLESNQVQPVISSVVTPVALEGFEYPFLLNKYPGAAAAYSLRALSSGWLAGDVVEVRRSSDSTTQDFTASQITRGELVAFCGAGDGFVSTWYDQSGNANDATQATTTAQPKIVDAGALVAGGIDFDGVDDSLGGISNLVSGTTASSSFIMGNADNTGVNEAMISQGNNGIVGSAYVITSEIAFRPGGNTVYDDDFVDANSLLLTTIAPSSSTSADVLTFLNGSGIGQISTTSTALDYTVSSAEIGDNRGLAFYDGRLSEIIFYASDQSANRVAIEANINDFYSIY